jgi:hypothetical protein
VTRISDIVPLFSNVPIGIFEVNGAELARIAGMVAKVKSGLLMPGFAAAKIEPARSYRVALPINVLWTFSASVKPAPQTYWLAGLDTGDAVERYFPLN